jgi:hypothetical protein
MAEQVEGARLASVTKLMMLPMVERIKEEQRRRDTIFRFFDLPRELRDNIVGYLFMDKVAQCQTREHTLYPRFAAVKFRVPLPYVRLVNRQMKREYDERSPTAIVTLALLEPILCPRSARQTTVIESSFSIGYTFFWGRSEYNSRFRNEYSALGRLNDQLQYRVRSVHLTLCMPVGSAIAFSAQLGDVPEHIDVASLGTVHGKLQYGYAPQLRTLSL